MGKATILLTAGGTGGHLFPAQALARVLSERGWQVHLATDERATRYSEDFPAREIHIIPSATPSGKNPIRMAMALLALARGVFKCRKLVKKLKPVAVVGFGGYPTIPPIIAATQLGVPAILHEANAVLGRANRFLAGRARFIATGFEIDDAGGTAKSVVTGNPVRAAVLQAAEISYPVRDLDDPFHLLVFGGSQGAQFFSQIVPDGLKLLSAKHLKQLKIVQQVRPEDRQNLSKALDELGIEAEVSPFFKDMAGQIARAHLVISRAGASTVSEIAVIGRPSILVPYPHALDHDQAANAAGLAATGGAEVVRQQVLSAIKLADILQSAMDQPEKLAKQAESAKKAAKPDAARLLADHVERIVANQI